MFKLCLSSWSPLNQQRSLNRERPAETSPTSALSPQFDDHHLGSTAYPYPLYHMTEITTDPSRGIVLPWL